MFHILLFTLSLAWSQNVTTTFPEGEIQVLTFVSSSWVQEDRLKLTFTVKDKHKIYKESLGLKTAIGSDVSFKNLQISPIETFYDKYSEKNKEGVQGTFEVVVDVFATQDIKDQNYPLLLGYQACSDEYCLFPQDFPFTVSLYIKNSSFSLNRLMSESLLLAMIFVFFAGFLTSFTPCIFPMIPLTLAVLVPRGQTLSFSQKLGRSLSYVLGIALTYSVFGLLAASSGMMFGSLLGNQYVAVAIGLFFVAFALSMLGFFEIKTPSHLSQSKWFNHSNTFLFGLAAGVVAGPCVGPVLLSILTFISQTGNLQTGFLLMMSFAFGMGLIFIILGVAGNIFQTLPRSGAWMNFTKYLFALIMLGLAFYYVYPALSSAGLLLFTFAVLAIVCGVYLRFYEEKFFVPLSGQTRTVLKVSSGLLIIAFFATALFYKKINEIQFYTGSDYGWVTYDDATFSEVLKNGKPTVVDFYADWCMACKELKARTFSDPVVIAEGQKINRLVINATHSSELIEKLKKEHHVIGLPTILFFDKQGQKRDDLTLTGFEPPKEFLTRIKKVME